MSDTLEIVGIREVHTPQHRYADYLGRGHYVGTEPCDPMDRVLASRIVKVRTTTWLGLHPDRVEETLESGDLPKSTTQDVEYGEWVESGDTPKP